VVHERAFSTWSRAAVCGLLLSTFVYASAQGTHPRAAPPQGRRVSLVSGVCPEVQLGDTLSLDWNPGFDHAGAVTGMSSINLIFSPTIAEGVGRKESRLALSLGGRYAPPLGAAYMGNGFYHLEFPIATRFAPGVYSLREANAKANVLPEYSGQAPEMTVSPVREHLCITVVDPSVTASSASGG